MEAIQRLLSLWPLMRKSTHCRIVAEAVECGRVKLRLANRRHSEVREGDLRSVDKIMERHTQHEWDRHDTGPHEFYRLCITLDPHMLTGSWIDDHAREMLARSMGRKVEFEIKTSKFIEKADETEARRENEQVRRYQDRP